MCEFDKGGYAEMASDLRDMTIPFVSTLNDFMLKS